MSLATALNKPPLVLAAGAAIAGGVPLLPIGSLSVGLLQAANILSFVVNVASVSVPGRLDGAQQDAQVKQGVLNPSESSSLTGGGSGSSGNGRDRIIEQRRLRSLVQPSGWAFSIWGLIYLGESAFCVAQFVDSTQVPAMLPDVTAPFVAANLLQSLWCASFRPSYNEGWHKYVSVAMLGGTAYSLSQIPFDAMSSSWFFVPLVAHFGWTTAATLVNLNSAVSAEESTSDRVLLGLGHGSATVATALGVSLTALGFSTPAYGLTIAWALLAVGSNPKLDPASRAGNNVLETGAKLQRMLCYSGSALCAAASLYSIFT